MEVIAKARYIRMSPRKVRLVADLVRGKDVSAAVAQLKFLRKDAARPVWKCIDSAVANAVHNHQLDKSTLYIKAITVDGGPTLKRFRPRAHGRAASILKRTSHIIVTVAPREEVVPASATAALVAAPAGAAKAAKAAKPAAKKAAKKTKSVTKKPAAKAAKRAKAAAKPAAKASKAKKA
jgi:large subunit ribosomal protein L22